MCINEFIEKHDIEFITCCKHIYRKYYLSNYIELDDFIQSCYLDITKKISKYDDKKSKLITFYYIIVQSRAKMIYRDSKAEKINNLYGRDVSINEDYKNNDNLSLEDSLFNRFILFDNVNFELFIENNFNEKERKFLILLSQGYSIKEISKIMDIEYFSLIRFKKKTFEKFKRCYI